MDGWINLDVSHGALHRQPCRNGGLAGAGSVCGAAGVRGDLTMAGILKQIPPALGSIPLQPALRGVFLPLAPLFARLTAPALSSGSSSLAAVLF